jgi:hypothetical protein
MKPQTSDPAQLSWTSPPRANAAGAAGGKGGPEWYGRGSGEPGDRLSTAKKFMGSDMMQQLSTEDLVTEFRHLAELEQAKHKKEYKTHLIGRLKMHCKLRKFLEAAAQFELFHYEKDALYLVNLVEREDYENLSASLIHVLLVLLDRATIQKSRTNQKTRIFSAEYIEEQHGHIQKGKNSLVDYMRQEDRQGSHDRKFRDQLIEDARRPASRPSSHLPDSQLTKEQRRMLELEEMKMQRRGQSHTQGNQNELRDKHKVDYTKEPLPYDDYQQRLSSRSKDKQDQRQTNQTGKNSVTNAPQHHNKEKQRASDKYNKGQETRNSDINIESLKQQGHYSREPVQDHRPSTDLNASLRNKSSEPINLSLSHSSHNNTSNIQRKSATRGAEPDFYNPSKTDHNSQKNHEQSPNRPSEGDLYNLSEEDDQATDKKWAHMRSSDEHDKHSPTQQQIKEAHEDEEESQRDDIDRHHNAKPPSKWDGVHLQTDKSKSGLFDDTHNASSPDMKKSNLATDSKKKNGSHVPDRKPEDKVYKSKTQESQKDESYYRRDTSPLRDEDTEYQDQEHSPTDAELAALVDADNYKKKNYKEKISKSYRNVKSVSGDIDLDDYTESASHTDNRSSHNPIKVKIEKKKKDNSDSNHDQNSPKAIEENTFRPKEHPLKDIKETPSSGLKSARPLSSKGSFTEKDSPLFGKSAKDTSQKAKPTQTKPVDAKNKSSTSGLYVKLDSFRPSSSSASPPGSKDKDKTNPGLASTPGFRKPPSNTQSGSEKSKDQQPSIKLLVKEANHKKNTSIDSARKVDGNNSRTSLKGKESIEKPFTFNDFGNTPKQNSPDSLFPSKLANNESSEVPKVRKFPENNSDSTPMGSQDELRLQEVKRDYRTPEGTLETTVDKDGIYSPPAGNKPNTSSSSGGGIASKPPVKKEQLHSSKDSRNGSKDKFNSPGTLFSTDKDRLPSSRSKDRVSVGSKNSKGSKESPFTKKPHADVIEISGDGKKKDSFFSNLDKSKPGHRQFKDSVDEPSDNPTGNLDAATGEKSDPLKADKTSADKKQLNSNPGTQSIKDLLKGSTSNVAHSSVGVNKDKPSSDLFNKSSKDNKKSSDYLFGTTKEAPKKSDTLFGSSKDPKKPSDSLFGTSNDKKTGDKVSAKERDGLKPLDSLFSTSKDKKTSNSLLGGETKDKKSTLPNSSIDKLKKPSDSLFGSSKDKVGKEKATLFASPAATTKKPVDSLFGSTSDKNKLPETKKESGSNKNITKSIPSVKDLLKDTKRPDSSHNLSEKASVDHKKSTEDITAGPSKLVKKDSSVSIGAKDKKLPSATSKPKPTSSISSITSPLFPSTVTGMNKPKTEVVKSQNTKRSVDSDKKSEKNAKPTLDASSNKYAVSPSPEDVPVSTRSKKSRKSITSDKQKTVPHPQKKPEAPKTDQKNEGMEVNVSKIPNARNESFEQDEDLGRLDKILKDSFKGQHDAREIGSIDFEPGTRLEDTTKSPGHQEEGRDNKQTEENVKDKQNAIEDHNHIIDKDQKSALDTNVSKPNTATQKITQADKKQSQVSTAPKRPSSKFDPSNSLADLFGKPSTQKPSTSTGSKSVKNSSVVGIKKPTQALSSIGSSIKSPAAGTNPLKTLTSNNSKLDTPPANLEQLEPTHEEKNTAEEQKSVSENKVQEKQSKAPASKSSSISRPPSKSPSLSVPKPKLGLTTLNLKKPSSVKSLSKPASQRSGAPVAGLSKPKPTSLLKDNKLTTTGLFTKPKGSSVTSKPRDSSLSSKASKPQSAVLFKPKATTGVSLGKSSVGERPKSAVSSSSGVKKIVPVPRKSLTKQSGSGLPKPTDVRLSSRSALSGRSASRPALQTIKERVDTKGSLRANKSVPNIGSKIEKKPSISSTKPTGQKLSSSIKLKDIVSGSKLIKGESKRSEEKSKAGNRLSSIGSNNSRSDKMSIGLGLKNSSSKPTIPRPSTGLATKTKSTDRPKTAGVGSLSTKKNKDSTLFSTKDLLKKSNPLVKSEVSLNKAKESKSKDKSKEINSRSPTEEKKVDRGDSKNIIESNGKEGLNELAKSKHDTSAVQKDKKSSKNNTKEKASTSSIKPRDKSPLADLFGTKKSSASIKQSKKPPQSNAVRTKSKDKVKQEREDSHERPKAEVEMTGKLNESGKTSKPLDKKVVEAKESSKVSAGLAKNEHSKVPSGLSSTRLDNSIRKGSDSGRKAGSSASKGASDKNKDKTSKKQPLPSTKSPVVELTEESDDHSPIQSRKDLVEKVKDKSKSKDKAGVSTATKDKKDKKLSGSSSKDAGVKIKKSKKEGVSSEKKSVEKKAKSTDKKVKKIVKAERDISDDEEEQRKTDRSISRRVKKSQTVDADKKKDKSIERGRSASSSNRPSSAKESKTSSKVSSTKGANKTTGRAKSKGYEVENKILEELEEDDEPVRRPIKNKQKTTADKGKTSSSLDKKDLIQKARKDKSELSAQSRRAKKGNSEGLSEQKDSRLAKGRSQTTNKKRAHTVEEESESEEVSSREEPEDDNNEEMGHLQDQNSFSDYSSLKHKLKYYNWKEGVQPYQKKETKEKLREEIHEAFEAFSYKGPLHKEGDANKSVSSNGAAGKIHKKSTNIKYGTPEKGKNYEEIGHIEDASKDQSVVLLSGARSPPYSSKKGEVLNLSKSFCSANKKNNKLTEEDYSMLSMICSNPNDPIEFSAHFTGTIGGKTKPWSKRHFPERDQSRIVHQKIV